MKRPPAVLFLALFALVSTGTLAAQCAMCREAAASQRKEQAEAFNKAILVLGAPPALVFGCVGVALWRRRDNGHSDPGSAGLK